MNRFARWTYAALALAVLASPASAAPSTDAQVTGVSLLPSPGRAELVIGLSGAVTVKDFRGGPAGWSLTGKVTDFTGPGAKIDAGKLSWTPACATKAGSPSTCQAGSTGTVEG